MTAARASSRWMSGAVVTRVILMGLTPHARLRRRRQFRLADFLPDGIHGGPDLIDLVLEAVAYQEVRHKAFQMRETFHEPPKAEAIVVRADQPPHPLDALHVSRFPLAELRARRVPLGQPLHN